MGTLVEEIRNARQNRQLSECFRASDVERACSGRARRAYRDYLSRHREGNPGGHPAYFRRNADESYSLVKEQEPPNATRDLDDAAAAQWVLSVPFDVRPGLDFRPHVLGVVRGYEYEISRLDEIHQIEFEDLPSVAVAQQIFDDLATGFAVASLYIRGGVRVEGELVVLDATSSLPGRRVPMIYPRGRSLAGITLGIGVVRFQPAIVVPKFTDGLHAGLELPNPENAMRDRRVQLAAKLYVGSYFEKSMEAQFMGLMSVLEVLKDQDSSPTQTVEMVDRWLGELRLSPTSDKESLKSRLEFLKVQSIGQGIKALVERHLPGQGKAARSLYDRRSKLVHEGGMNDDIAATLREAEGLVRSLFAKILSAGAR